MQPLPNRGISADSVHPSAWPFGGGNLTDPALQYGYNVRNLLAVQTLHKLGNLVIYNGPADCQFESIAPAITDYVAGLYQTLLHRAPQAWELEYWSRPIHCGGPLGHAARGIWNSVEHRGLQVDSYYRAYLHREPDTTGWTYWVNTFLSGASEVQVQRGFLTSTEYMEAHGSEVEYIAGLYADVLNRDLDSDKMPHWQATFDAGVGRDVVAEAFLLSPEEEKNVIDSYFSEYLGRQATRPEADFWIAHLQAHDYTYQTAALTFLIADEFVRRWQ
jgi:hypothetical protein